MASCLITVSGTSGIVRVDYKISSIPYSIESSIGTFYIEDTATDVTYTTLTGDAIASSGCLTITDQPLTCYDLFWKNIKTSGYYADAIIIGGDTLLISEVQFPLTGLDLADAINSVVDDRVKVIAFKSVYTNTTGRQVDAQYDMYYILQVVGTDVPVLRVRNSDSTNHIYIYGIVAGSCTIPVDYTSVEPCYSTLVTTTTTVAP